MDTVNSDKVLEIREVLKAIPRQRGQLLPALWRVMDNYREISPEAIEAVSETLGVPYAEVHGVASFYSLFDNAGGHKPVYICSDVMCALNGSQDLIDAARAVAQNYSASVKPSACLGQCDHAPAIFVGDAIWRQATVENVVAVVRDEEDKP